MTYFFDTCALLHNFKKDLPKGFYISSITLKELENIKTSCHKDEEVKYQARQLLHKLEKADYNVELYNSYLDEYLISYDLPDTNDSKIIVTALALKTKHPDLVFCTQDLACKAIAKATGLNVKYEDEEVAEEEEVGDTIPQNVKDAFPNASPSQTTLYDLQKAFSGSHQNLVLFVDNDYKEWDYDGKETGWRPQLMNNFVIKSDTTTFCVMESDDNAIVDPIMSMIREFKAWAKGGDAKIMRNPWVSNGLYPLAYIDGNLYFTSSKEHAQLNVQWGNEVMFFVRIDNPITQAKAIDTSFKPSTMLIKLSGNEYREIGSTQLGGILQSKSEGLIDQFIGYAKQNSGKLTISYQDEHLKSIMGMILTLQTVEHFVKQIDKDFTIEFKLETYRDDKGKSDSITANMPSSDVRDSKLKLLTTDWLKNLSYNDDIKGDLVPIQPGDKRSLTHWRELSIICGKKKLCIYPDGGFINEWNISSNNERFDANYITPDVNINIYRNKEIKFDITIEDC